MDNTQKQDEDELCFVWHISRARFSFEDLNEYEKWKQEEKVSFEIDPSNSDDRGAGLFEDPKDGCADFEVNESNGALSISLADDGPIISAWIGWTPRLREGVGEEDVLRWAEEMGGWFSGTITLSGFDASITDDDGGSIFPYSDPD